MQCGKDHQLFQCQTNCKHLRILNHCSIIILNFEIKWRREMNKSTKFHWDRLYMSINPWAQGKNFPDSPIFSFFFPVSLTGRNHNSQQISIYDGLTMAWPHFSNSTSLHFPSTSAALGSLFTRSWRHYSAGRCTRLLASRLLQCCAGRFTGDNTSTGVVASAPCRRSTGERPTTTRPRYVGPQGASLATDCSTNRVQTVPACPQVDCRSSSSVHE